MKLTDLNNIDCGQQRYVGIVKSFDKLKQLGYLQADVLSNRFIGFDTPQKMEVAIMKEDFHRLNLYAGCIVSFQLAIFAPDHNGSFRGKEELEEAAAVGSSAGLKKLPSVMELGGEKKPIVYKMDSLLTRLFFLIWCQTHALYLTARSRCR